MKTYIIKKIAVLLVFSAPVILFAQEATEPKPAAEVVKGTFENSVLINNNTVITQDKGFLEFGIQHRFGLADKGSDLYGVYAPANIRLYLGYGITKRLSVAVGVTKTKNLYDFSWKYAILKQKTYGMPISISYSGNVARTAVNQNQLVNQDNQYKKIDRLSYYNEIMFARKFNKKLSLQVGVHYVHYNMVDSVMLYKHHDLYGFSTIGRYKFSPQGSFMIEYDHPLNVSDIDKSKRPLPNLGLGVEFSTGYHQFQIFICNTNGILSQEAKYFNYNDFTNTGIPAWLIGFNITRQFGIGQ